MPGRFSIETVFKAIDRVSAPVKRMQSRVQKFSNRTRVGINKAAFAFGKLGREIKGAAIIGVAAFAALGAAMLPVINTTAKFEQSLTNAAAKFPGMVKGGKLVASQFKKIEDVARRTGATTEFTATQSAEALNKLAMAGFSAEKAIAALPSIVDLATASQTDLASASDIATDALGAFGLNVEDPIQNAKNLQMVIDVMGKTATTSNTNLEMMMETIKNGGPVAKAAGQSIATFSAFAGVLANSGIKASDAGTTLKNVFTRLTGPTGKAAKILKRIGVSARDGNGNFRDAVDIIGELKNGLNGLGSADRLAAIKEIFGKIPLAGVNVLLDESTDKLVKYRKSIEDSSGATAQMAKIMRNTLQGRINNLTSAFEGLQITIGKTGSGPINFVIVKITDFIRVVDEAISNNTVWGKVLKFLGAAFVVVASAIAFFSSIVIAQKVAMFAWAGAVKAWVVVTKLATAAQWLWNAAMMANPIGLVIAAILLLIAAGVLLVKNWDEIVGGALVLWDMLKGAWQSGVDFLSDKIFGFLQAWDDFWTNMKENPVEAVTSILKTIAKLTNPLNALKSAGEFIGGKVGDFIFGSDDEDSSASAPAMVTPQERNARKIDETRTTSTAELTVRAEQGTNAELTKSNKMPGIGLNMMPSGAF